VTRPRTLAIGLDGYEPSIGDALMAAGRLPNLARLRARSARFELDHGPAKRTGLAWEHVSLGKTPEAAGRYAPIHFDARRYRAVQRGCIAAPFLAGLDVRSVVMDAPYFDLLRTENARGVVAWGAHDPGCAPYSRPTSLRAEIDARFGSYPARPYIYGFVWPDARRTRAMGEALARAVDTRAAIGRWLLAERLPDWDLALLVVSELHSALEALWHGVDPDHPLHAVASAEPARDGVHGIYAAVDRLVGTLWAAAPDARIVLFSMHGMGPNNSDVPSMLLLPELLYRAQHGRALFAPKPEWQATPDGVPRLGAGESWSHAVLGCIPSREPRERARRWWRRAGRRLGLRGTHGARLGWMPAACYQPAWSGMDAFALPSFYDGRIRINLAGRERRGRVAPGDYEARCGEVARLVAECRDPRTGEPVAAEVERTARGDPRDVGETEADLVVTWRGAPLAFQHPRLGVIGPAPYRRPGGHTGGRGVGYLLLPDVAPGDYGLRSAFDVVPTLLELCGVTAGGVSGESLLPDVGRRVGPSRETSEPSRADGRLSHPS
jgi:predicted AlkP superfamily phosphohydrolase/phosphomutase